MVTKKILITGAFGFIGSHLTEYLIESGYEIIAFDRYNINNHYGWLHNSKYKNEINFILGDIRDYDSVYKAMKGCSAVFHLAALIGIPYSYISPLAYLKTNVEGTYNVLESSKNHNLDQVLITSTSETYGSAQYLPIDEKHPLVGQSPYSASKIAADHLSISYYRSFNLPIKIVRPFNTYGPRQSPRAIIPTIILQILNNNKKIKIGNITTERDLTFVNDTCNGFLEIYKSNKFFGEIVNIGMNNKISIEKLLYIIQNLMNIKIPYEVDSLRIRPEKSEVDVLCCNNNKIINYSNWLPKYDLEKGLLKTIQWLEKNYSFYQSNSYNV
tara:strand:+ start:2055 stop:3035 length:981 start_codon:yes stop_codon:yes gene_type:complete